MQQDADTGAALAPSAMESLRLPAAFDATAHATARDIDAGLSQNERQAVAFDDKVAAYRDAGLRHLLKLRGRQVFDPSQFGWPPFLFIPKDANSREYWPFTAAPDDHRYALEWASPVTATANKASRQNGTLFSFAQLHNEAAGAAQSSESGIGILYDPPMSLGVIDFQPSVDCSGTLRTFLEFFPLLAPGYVEVKAYLLLAAWQVIPGGFDLSGWKQFEVATSSRIDQSFGPGEQYFQQSFAGPSLSAPFVVQRGRTYLLGVVGRISITSTLTADDGRPLPTISNSELRVWGAMNCIVPQIDIMTRRVDIP